jgi:hypothetical protein
LCPLVRDEEEDTVGWFKFCGKIAGYLTLMSLRWVFDLTGELPLSLVSVRLKSKLLPV